MDTIENIKNSIWTPIIILFILFAWIFMQTNISIFDYLSDKVIERIETKYSPFGPTPPKEVK